MTDSRQPPAYAPPGPSDSWISETESERRRTTGERLTRLETKLGLLKWIVGVLLSAAIILTALIGVLIRLAALVQ